MSEPAAMEIKYKPGLLRTVRSECTENAGILDFVINEVLLEELEDKTVPSAIETLSEFQISLQELGATLAREVRLLESMRAKAAHFRLDFNLDKSKLSDPSPEIAEVPQQTSQPQISMFRGLCARYPTAREDRAAIISYDPPLLRRIQRRCTDDAASQVLIINDILQDQFARKPTPMKIEILANFERHLRRVGDTFLEEMTILDAMGRRAAVLRRHYEAELDTTCEVGKEVLSKRERDAQENECLPEPVSPDYPSSNSSTFTQENVIAEDTGENVLDWRRDATPGSEDLCSQDGSQKPPTTPEEVLKLLQVLPLRAKTLKGYDFSFIKGFMNGVLQLCGLILELDSKNFANADAKRIVDACFEAAGQPYELVFYGHDDGYLKMNFVKLSNQDAASGFAASVATHAAPAIPDAFERSVSQAGRTPNHEVDEVIDSIEQVSPNSDYAANRKADENGDDVVMRDVLSIGELDAWSAGASITTEHGVSNILPSEHVSDVRDTGSTADPISVVDNAHGLPTSRVKPSLDEREEDVLRRFAAEYDHLENPNDSYLVTGTFDERRKRRELAEEALGILVSKYSLVSTLSKDAENYLLFRFTDHGLSHLQAADVLPQKLTRNENTDDEIHFPPPISTTSIKHRDSEPMDSSTDIPSTPVVLCKQEGDDPFIYDATPPSEKTRLGSKVSSAQIRTDYPMNLRQSPQRGPRSFSTMATESLALSPPVSEPANSANHGRKSNDQIVDGASTNIDEDRGTNLIEENVTREELFATIERNWGASIDDVCTRPLWRRVPGRGLLKLLVRLSEVCDLTDANAQLRAEIRVRRKHDPNLLHVNGSVLRSLVAANEAFKTQTPNEDGGSFSADSPRAFSKIVSAEDRSVSIDHSGADGGREATEIDQDTHIEVEQQGDIEESEPRKNRYTSKEVALLIQLKKEGKSWQEIGEVFKPFYRTLASLRFKWWSLKTRPSAGLKTMLDASRHSLPAEPREHDTNASLMDESGLRKGGPVRSEIANKSSARKADQTLRHQEMPTFAEEILETGHRQSGERGRRNRYTSDDIELLLRLKQENKTWLQIEERFKGTTHTMRSLQSKYATLKPDLNGAAELVSENLHELSSDEPSTEDPSTGEHVNIIPASCEAAATGATMGEKEHAKVASVTESDSVNADLRAPSLPEFGANSPESSLCTALSLRLPMAFRQVMDSADYGCFKATVNSHEDELPEERFNRLLSLGTEKLERKNVQSAENVEAVADALWVSIISQASSSLKDKWVAIEELDRTFTYFVVNHGGFGLIDVKKKVLRRKFGRTRKACTAGTYGTTKIVRQMLDANPRPERRRPVEEAVRVAQTYIGNAQTVAEVEVRAYDLFEAILDGCRHNSKVTQSAVSSLTVALERHLDAAQNRALSRDDINTPLTEAKVNEAVSSPKMPEGAQSRPAPIVEDEPRQPSLAMRTNSVSDNHELSSEVLVLKLIHSEGQQLGSQSDLVNNTMSVPNITEGPSDDTLGKSATDLQVSEVANSETLRESSAASEASSPNAEARNGVADFEAAATHAPSTRTVEDEDDMDRPPDLPVVHKPKQSSPASTPHKEPNIGTFKPQTTLSKDNDPVVISVEDNTTPNKPKSLSERIKRSRSSQISQNEEVVRHLRPIPSDKDKIQMNGTSHAVEDKNDEGVELPSKIYTLSGLNENRRRVTDSADDGSSKHVTMSPVSVPLAETQSLDAASMHRGSPPLGSAIPPALASAQPTFSTLQTQEVPVIDAPFLHADEVKQVIDAILHHPISNVRKFAFDLVTKVLESRDANTLAKAQAINRLLYNGFKEYGGKDNNTSLGHFGLSEAVREHIQNKSLNKRRPNYELSDNHATSSNISRETLAERPSTWSASTELPAGPSFGSVTKIHLTPESLKSFTKDTSQTDAHCIAADMLAANPDPTSRSTNQSQIDIALQFLKAREPDSMATLEDMAFELVKCINVVRKRSFPLEAQYCAEDSVHQAMAIYTEQSHFRQRDVASSGQSIEAMRAAAGQASKSVSSEDPPPHRIPRLSPLSKALVEKEIGACARAANSDHGCNCQIYTFISEWFLEGKLLTLNEFGAIQLSTFLHMAEYRPLAIAMIVDEDPDMAQYRNAFAAILCMALVEDTFKSCYRVGLAPQYARQKEGVEPPATSHATIDDPTSVEAVRFCTQTSPDGPVNTKESSPSNSSKPLMGRHLEAEITAPASKHVLHAPTVATIVARGNACEELPRKRSLESMEDGSECIDAAPDVLARQRLFSDRRFDNAQTNLADPAGNGKPSSVQSYTLGQNTVSLEDRASESQHTPDTSNSMKRQPMAFMQCSLPQCSLPARPPAAWNGSSFAVSESTKKVSPESASDIPKEPFSATHSDQPSPSADEHVKCASWTPSFPKFGTMVGPADTPCTSDPDRFETIENLEKAFVWSLNKLKDIGEFNGQELEQTARSLALRLEQAIHNSSIEKHVYLRRARTYVNALDGYAGWTKRLLDDPEYVEVLIQMVAERLSKETRLGRTQDPRMGEELVTEQQSSIEKVAAQMSPLLVTQQGPRTISSQCSPAQPQPGDAEGSRKSCSSPTSASALPGQDSLTQAPTTPDQHSVSRKRASSTTLKLPTNKRKVKAASLKRFGDFATKEKATHHQPPLMPTLAEQSTAAKAVETEGAVLAQSSRIVSTLQSAQSSSLNSVYQHEEAIIAQCGRPSMGADQSTAQLHRSSVSTRVSATPVATPHQELQTICLTDEAVPTVVAAGKDYGQHISQVPDASPAVFATSESHNQYGSPHIPPQPPTTPPSAASFYNQDVLSPKEDVTMKHIIHDLAPLPELPAVGIPTAYDDTYEEFPPGLNIEAPTRQASPVTMFPFANLSNLLPLDELDPSGFAFVQNERGEWNRETWGFVTRQTPTPTLVVPTGAEEGFNGRDEAEWLEKSAMARWIDENGEIKEEALSVPLDL